MSNTGNTQQIIDYGATANDGQGDPLRTAFIKTDENFSNIWAAGPVGSNITIANNTIQNDSTNGNIILKPNGIGIVQSNAHVLPNTTDVRNLGSANRRWRQLYVGVGGIDNIGNLTANNFTTNDFTANGDVTIGGNLSVNTIFSDDSSFVTVIDGLNVHGELDVSGNVVVDTLEVKTIMLNPANGPNVPNVLATINVVDDVVFEGDVDVDGSLFVMGNISSDICSAYMIDCQILKLQPVAVASLPLANVVGAGTRAFVTDANTMVFGSTITGGLANSVPVYSDGTSWRVG